MRRLNRCRRVVALVALLAVAACGRSGDPTLTPLLITRSDLGDGEWRVQDISDDDSRDEVSHRAVEGCDLITPKISIGAKAKVHKYGNDEYVLSILSKSDELLASTKQFVSKCTKFQNTSAAQARVEIIDLPASGADDQIGYKLSFSSYGDSLVAMLVAVARVGQTSLMIATSPQKREQPFRAVFDPVFVKQVERLRGQHG